jgi:transcriptional regulator with XRE-family HTH domain
MADDRLNHLRREQGRALVRALHVSELQAAGAARNVALHEAELQLDRIARLLPDATQGGLTLAEVARITGVSRPTLYQLRARYGDAGDIRLAVLQTVANEGEIPLPEVVSTIARDDKETESTAFALVDEGLLEIDPVTYLDTGETVPGLSLSHQGADTLEAWEFSLDETDLDAP